MQYKHDEESNFHADATVLESKNQFLPPILYLPDTMAEWPWPRTLNVHYLDVQRESGEWFLGFDALGPRSQSAFTKCNFGEQ